jgi:hypothetical protein
MTYEAAFSYARTKQRMLNKCRHSNKKKNINQYFPPSRKQQITMHKPAMN